MLMEGMKQELITYSITSLSHNLMTMMHNGLIPLHQLNQPSEKTEVITSVILSLSLNWPHLMGICTLRIFWIGWIVLRIILSV